MKTFRFFATLLVIALCAGFTSCSDDDEEENSVEISLANLQGTWDMIKCYGWEYDDNNQKENWTEDVSGEYIFFEDTDGNGGYRHYFNSYHFRRQIYRMIQGIKVSSISKSEIAKTTILTPPYDVQRKVASVLSEVDHLIEKEAETVIVLQKIRRGLLQQLFI